MTILYTQHSYEALCVLDHQAYSNLLTAPQPLFGSPQVHQEHELPRPYSPGDIIPQHLLHPPMSPGLVSTPLLMRYIALTLSNHMACRFFINF